MQEIIVGKHTLESLTSGMYADPFVIYREYIQNSVDSIDEAIRSGILKKGEERIDVVLHYSEKRVEIFDNGIGIASVLAVPYLLSIGNSRKELSNSRGFRGIGRLSGLSYCSLLTFETSSEGEALKTRIIIDAKKLAKLLLDDKENEATVFDVLNEVYQVEHIPEEKSSHYFKVVMEGVEDTTKLIDFSEVFDYLTQNIPVPYDPDFTWGEEINSRIAKCGYDIRAYRVFISQKNMHLPVYKAYKNSFLADKGKKLYDSIADIQILEFRNADKQLLAVGWLGKTNYYGSIYDRTVKGLRLRTGNILIGDNQTLNTVFKDARFNGWAIGEIFTIDKGLIPNARRDNYEKNTTYFAFIEKLTTLASQITKDIRATSLRRNAELSAALEQTAAIAEKASAVIAEGATTAQKAAIKAKIVGAQSLINNAKTNDEEGEYYQEIAFEELDMLIGSIQGTTSYKALNAMKGITTNEKKVLEKVLNLIRDFDPENTSELVNFILNNYVQGGAK